MRATQFSDVVTFHGEGPFWDEQRKRLLVMDMLAGAIVEFDGDRPPARHDFGGIAAAIRRRRRGGFVLAIERGIRFLDDDLRPDGDLRQLFDDPDIRMNEGGCDREGRFFLGSMAYDQAAGAGTLYRIDADGSVHTALSGVTISNGIQWSSEGRTAYYNDTPTNRVSRFAFDPDSGALTGRTTLVEIPDGDGHPDGMAIDDEGGLWVAFYGGSAVRRFDREGRLTEVIDVPARDVTCCTFGGPNRSTLYITTSREGGDTAPGAGAVFEVDPGVRGAEQHPYAG